MVRVREKAALPNENGLKKQASSIEQLDKQWNWFNSAYRTRRVPGALEIVVSTRWAPLDIPGRLISATEKGKAAERWDVVRLPLKYGRHQDDVERGMVKRRTRRKEQVCVVENIEAFKPRQCIYPYANRKARWLIAHHQISQ